MARRYSADDMASMRASLTYIHVRLNSAQVAEQVEKAMERGLDPRELQEHANLYAETRREMGVDVHSQSVVIYGNGGHGREMALAARPLAATFHTDDQPAKLRGGEQVCVAVGSPETRKKLADKMADHPPADIIAPTAVIAPSAKIGPGAQICDFSYIGPDTKIGKQFQCNVRSHVHHDCVIGDYVTFSPGTLCLGTVHIGDNVFVGAGAILRNGSPGKPLVIGDGATVGMGAVVTKDVPAGVTVVGNPARPLRP